VVASALWDGAGANVGAATFCADPNGCVNQIVSASNSLVGSAANDNVAELVTVLTNGNYVVSSPKWNNGTAADAGASTFCDGAGGCTGAVSTANSLVGTTMGDNVGLGGAALTSGNYVVRSPNWDGAFVNVGAATFCSGTGGCAGTTVSAANSLVGSQENDNVALGGIFSLSNGDYVVRSGNWDNSAVVNTGAMTYGSGNGDTVGEITSSNSVLGTTAAGGSSMNFAFDPTNNQLVVGRPADNLVTLFRLPTIRVTSITKTGNSVVLQGTGVPNAVHKIQARSSLTQPFDPTPIGSTTANPNGNFSFTDSTNLPQRFYRVGYP